MVWETGRLKVLCNTGPPEYPLELWVPTFLLGFLTHEMCLLFNQVDRWEYCMVAPKVPAIWNEVVQCGVRREQHVSGSKEPTYAAPITTDADMGMCPSAVNRAGALRRALR